MAKRTGFLRSLATTRPVVSRRAVVKHLLAGQIVGIGFLSGTVNPLYHSKKLSASGVILGARNAVNAKAASALADGSIVILGGLSYEVVRRATGAASVLHDLDIDGLVPFNQAFAGHFGIENSGDQAAKIAAACQWSIDTGKSVKFPKGEFISNKRLSMQGAVRIEGEGDETIFDFSALTTQQTLIEISQKETGHTIISNALPIAAGTETITIANAASYSVGDMVLLRSTESFSTTTRGVVDGNRRGELGIIASISGNHIKLTQGLRDTYLSGTITVTRVTPNIKPSLKSFRIKGGGPSARQWGLHVNFAIEPEVAEISFEDVEDTGVSLSYCDGGYVHDCVGDGIAGIVSQTGYAFAADLMTRDAVFENLRSNNSSCLFSTGGLFPVWDNVATKCVATNSASARPAIQTHINGVRTVVDQCSVKGATVGIGMFGPFSRVQNNLVIECSNSGIYTSDEGSVGIIVADNKVISCLTGINIGSNSGARRSVGRVRSNYVSEGTGGSAGISCTASDIIIDSPYIDGHSPGMLIQGDRVTVVNPTIFNIGPSGNHIGIYWLGNNGRIDGGRIGKKNGKSFVYGVAVIGKQLFIVDTEIIGVSDANALSKADPASIVAQNIMVNGKIRNW